MRRALIFTPLAAVLLAGCSFQLPPGPVRASVPPAPRSIGGELLTAADLPAGWSTIGPTAAPGNTSSCSALNGQSWQRLPEHAGIVLQQPAHDAFVTEALEAGSMAQATESYSASYAAASQCRAFTVTAPGGPVRYSLTPQSFPTYGDASYAFAITVSSGVVTESGDIAVVRKGATLVQIIAVGSAGVPLSTAELVTRAAVAKVQ